MSDKKMNIPRPELQIDFSYLLGKIKKMHLQDALAETVVNINLAELNSELSKLVPEMELKKLARKGIRGELLFPAPCILKSNPYLLGYYRLLLGFSQKEFYTSKFGIASFKSMEQKGTISQKNKLLLEELCQALISSAIKLLDGIGFERASQRFFEELCLLTLGGQLRGSANNKRGNLGIQIVFEIIKDIVSHAIIEYFEKRIIIESAAERKVIIEFAADPDIIIRMFTYEDKYRNLIAIEIKAGEDYSNIHNRIGEAEKSHQKAKIDGYIECWTIYNVENLNLKKARSESPTTNQFYNLIYLKDKTSSEYNDFRHQILTLTGIKNS